MINLGNAQGGVPPITGTSGFIQADALLVFELALILYSQARYLEAADAFTRMTKLNAWSHPTYMILTIGADANPVLQTFEYAEASPGCYISLGRLDDAQGLLDHVARLTLQQRTHRRQGGSDLPTEVYIKQKRALHYMVSGVVF